MKHFYFTLLFISLSFFVSAQDSGGSPVQGLIPIKRIGGQLTEKASNSTSRTDETVKTLTTAPTGYSQEVGITEGQLSVSLTGGASYSIPIAVPPGINGVVPQISLAYNSQGGNGMAGYGWNISGVSSITRIPSTKFHDGTIDPVDFDNLDRFAFDGQRLILKSGTYGMAGAVYETENFSNLKIETYGITLNPTRFYFKINYPDGSSAIYDAEGSGTGSNFLIRSWTNSQGVTITYKYIYDGNNSYIDAIQYGHIAAGIPINTIQFKYIPRQRPEQYYVGGISFNLSKKLSSINVIGNGVDFRNYNLEYDTASLGYDRLERITEKSGVGGKSYNPTVFSYDTTINEAISLKPNIVSLSLGQIESRNIATVTGDFDGDGKMDFVLYPTWRGDPNYKNKFWVHTDLNKSSFNSGKEAACGSFEEIFTSTWLSSDNKMMPFQGITAVQLATDSRAVNFNTYCSTSYGVSLQYSKQVTFPIIGDCTGDLPKFKKYLSGDFNGDGLTDVIAVDKEIECVETIEDPWDGTRQVYSRSSSGKVYFIDLDRRKTTNFWNETGTLLDYFYETDRIETLDVNGDGKTDILHFTNKKVIVYTLNDNNQLVFLWQTPDQHIVTDQPILPGDYNGDGKMDFIIPKSTGLWAQDYAKYLSTGNSFVKSEQSYGFVNRGSFIDKDGNVDINYHIPLDFNGDGKTDIVDFRTAYGKTYDGGRIIITSYKNQDDGFFSSASYDTGAKREIRSYAVPIFLSPTKNNQYFEVGAVSDNSMYSFQTNKNFSKEKLLKSITTGNGVTETITYKPLQQDEYEDTYTPSSSIETYPNIDIKVAPSLQVVSQLEKQSKSVYKKQLFSYYGAVTNTEGLGFLGFRSTMRTNWFENYNQIISSISKFDLNLRGANVENYTYLGYTSPTIITNNTVSKVPRISKITVNNTRTETEILLATNSITFSPGATITPTAGSIFIAQITPDYDTNGYAETNTSPPSGLISKSLSFYETSLSPTKVFKLQNVQSNNYNILESTSNETNTIYDEYSNPIESITKLRSGGVGQQTTRSVIAYESILSPYIVGRPNNKTQSVTASGDTMTSEESYFYKNSLLWRIEKKGHNTPEKIAEENEYDLFGNITKKTIVAGTLVPRVTNYEYDPSGRFLIKSKDIDGLETIFDYDWSSGFLKSETNPYKLTTTYTPDSWFNKIKTTDYLGKTNDYIYTRDTEKTIVTTTGSDGSASVETFDNLGRKIKSGAKDISGNYSYVETKYDIYDRVLSVSEPYATSAIQFNTTEYDQYGRPKYSKAFTGKTVTIKYEGLTTTVDDNIKVKVSRKNAMGNVVSLTETPGGTINYTYFTNGNLKETNYDGTKITIEQDGWGRKKTLTDPSAGTYSYTYNTLGEALTETTPNGTTTYILTDTGKLDKKSIKGINTNTETVYGYNADKLLGSSTFTDMNKDGLKTTITNTFGYDGYKRLNTTTEITANNATFEKVLTFDEFGRTKLETTKGTLGGKTSSKTIEHKYKNGCHEQLVDNATGQVLWKTNTTNVRGQLLTAMLGNGIAITNEYDEYGLVKLMKQDKADIGVTLMTFTTMFDPIRGNLKMRTNSLFDWTENFEDGGYDNQDRLLKWKNVNGDFETQSYEDSGRIKANSLGKYNYNNVKDGKSVKYQNSSIELTQSASAYYSNAKLSQTITYNTFKSPVVIEEGTNKLRFTYNDGNDRSTMTTILKDAQGVETVTIIKTYSANGSMEIKEDKKTGAIEFVMYLGGDGYAAPIVLKSDGTTQNYLYLHRDYQGSILAITNQAGQVVEKRLFDAWGAILKVQDGAGNTLTAGLTILDRGYTGHEHLQSVGLINMNGRIYDPKLHRFLQPDNFVQDPSNTQNYNRYGYCVNNPLKYTDKNGEFFFVAMIVGAIIGAYIGGSKANDNWNPTKWDYSSGKTWAGMGTGALIGAVAGEVAWAGVTGQLAFGIFNVSLGAGVAIPGVGTLGIFKSGEYFGSQFTNTNGQTFNQNIVTVPVVKPKSDDVGGGNSSEGYDATGGVLTGLGTGLTAGEIKMFNQSTWFSVRQWKTYSQSFNGNGYTGGKIASALEISKGFKWAGRGLGAYNAWSINEQYKDGKLNTSGMVMEQSSNLYTVVGGLNGAAWGIGWEGGRAITTTDWYQDWKNKYWYPWRHEHFGY